MPAEAAEGVEQAHQYILDEITEKVLHVLLDHPTVPYNKKTLAEAAGVSRDALYRRWDTYVDRGIIRRSEVGGRGEYWELDEDSELVDQLARIILEA